MIKISLRDLNIDFEFGNLSPYMPQEQYDSLEENLVDHGCRDPLLIWNDYIIDGHYRYNLCHKWGIPFPVEKINFPSRDDAIIWICRQHLKKQYLTATNQRYLIGKYFNAGRAVISREHGEININGKFLSARYLAAAKIAEGYSFSHHAVYKYGTMADAIDVIFTKEPELAHRILSEQIKGSYANIRAVSKLPKDKLRSLNRYLSDNRQDHILYSHIEHELQTRSSGSQHPEARIPQKQSETIQAEIKEMPRYDPDAEIASLALTIPSWISSIERAQSMTNLQLISAGARERIKVQLYQLSSTTATLLNAVKENE